MYTPELTPHSYSSAYLWNELQKIRDEINALRKLTGTISDQDYVWDEYVTSGLAVTPGGASPPTLAAFRGGIKLYEFLGTGVTTKEVYATTHILHGIKPGSDMHLHVHWSTTTTATAGSTVVWQVEYTVARGYGAGVYGDPTTTPSSTAYKTMSITATASVSPYTHMIHGDGVMVLPAQTELEVDSVILLRLYRDPAHVADTCSQHAYLIQLDWHYQRDRLGTVERNRPFGSWR